MVHHGTGRAALPPTPTAVLQGYYDAQGSLIALVDAGGSVVRRYAYDPWGRRVDPDDWTQDDTQTDLYHINRGYTMHEHLREFGLINMNGRVFDPAVAQFLSPDNYIQADGNWLNYNRYAYCLNNPLKYTDPSGEIVWETVLLGAYVCGVVNMMTNSAAILNSQNSCLTALGYFGIGALAGAVGGIAGGAAYGAMMYSGFIGGAVSGAAGGAASGFILGAGNAWMGGASFGNGLLAGFKSAAISAASGALLGGITEGLMAKSEGYSFWNGCGDDMQVEAALLGDNYSKLDTKNMDAYLKDRISMYFDGLQEGQYGIAKITTGCNKDYIILDDGVYTELSTGRKIAGYCRSVFDKGTSVHISPRVATTGNVDVFYAHTGHELIHAYHHYIFSSNFNQVFSETAAYKFTYEVFQRSNMNIASYSYYNVALRHQFVSQYPYWYRANDIPFLKTFYAN